MTNKFSRTHWKPLKVTEPTLSKKQHSADNIPWNQLNWFPRQCFYLVKYNENTNLPEGSSAFLALKILSK